MADNSKNNIPNLSRYQKLEHKYLGKVDSFLKDERASKLLSSFLNADTYIIRSSRLETANYDPRWLNEIEDVLSDLGDIINNPRKVTKEVTDIVPVELAKKTNAESVRHLASHTQFVKDITEDGDVIPNKILNIGADDNYITYENKFIATLIRRLVIFVEKRYDFMIKYAPLKEKDVLMYKTKAIIDGMEVLVETKVSVTKASPEKIAGESVNYLKRIDEVRKYLRYYYNSDFMKMFKSEKDVHGAILQTNIIRKNPKYHHCYKLYKYIESYSNAGVDLKVKETYAKFTPNEIAILAKLGVACFLAVNSGEPSPNELYKERTYKPKILKTIDDDVFIYGPLNYEDVEFVRVDKQYLEARRKNENLSNLLRYPTRAEAEYQSDLRNAKHGVQDDDQEIEALLKRKAKQQKAFQAIQARLDAEEQARIAEERRLEAERIAAEQARLIEEERERIRLAAQEAEEVPEEAAVEEPITEEEPIMEELPVEETPAEEPVIEETPAPEPPVEEPVSEPEPEIVPESEPQEAEEVPEEPVIEEQPEEEPAPEPQEETIEEQPQEEPVPAEEPLPVEEPAPVKKPRKKRTTKKKKTTRKKKVAPTPVEEPVSEPEPIPEPIPEPEPEPVPEEPAPVEEAPVEEPAPVKKAPRKRAPRKKKPAPAKEPVVEPAPEPASEPEPAPIKKAPKKKASSKKKSTAKKKNTAEPKKNSKKPAVKKPKPEPEVIVPSVGPGAKRKPKNKKKWKK